MGEIEFNKQAVKPLQLCQVMSENLNEDDNRGHPSEISPPFYLFRGKGRWPLKRVYFHHRVDFLVNMESIKDTHDKRVFKCFDYSSPPILDSYLPSPFLKQS